MRSSTRFRSRVRGVGGGLAAGLAAALALTSTANAATGLPDRQMARSSLTTATTLATAAGSAHLSYWGGRVVRNVRVVIVVWGSGTYQSQVTSNSSSNIVSFYGGIEKSSYVDWLREYNTASDAIGRGSVVGRYVIMPAAHNNGSVVDDVSNIRPELAAQIRAHRLPAPDANTVYALYFHRGQVVRQGGTDSSHGFCAYHNTVRWSSTLNLRYMVLPPGATGTHCGPLPGFGNLQIAASHELLEAITDPDVGLATRVGPPLAWYDRANGEIADICIGNIASVRGGDGRMYTVQRAWSNRRRTCVAS
jgi:hypothetical protein